MKWDPKKERRLSVLKFLVYAVSGVLLCFIGNAWYTLGIRTPALIPLFSVTVGFFEGGIPGALYGAFFGFCSDLSGSASFFLSPLLCGAAGFFAGIVTERFWKRNFPVWLSESAILALLWSGYILLSSLTRARGTFLWSAGMTELLKNACATFLWGLFLWFPSLWTSRISGASGKAVYVRGKTRRL